MKRSIVILMFFLFIFTLPSVAHASRPIHIFLNGNQLNLQKSPVMVNKEAMISLHTITKFLGAEVTWNKTDGSVIVKNNVVRMSLRVNNTHASVNGRNVTLQTAPTLVNDDVMIPLRFISEQLDLRFLWDNFANAAYLFQRANVSVQKKSYEVVTTSVETKTTNTVTNDKAINTNEKTSESVTATVATMEITNQAKNEVTDTATIHSTTPEVDSIIMIGNRITIKGKGTLKPTAFYIENPTRLVIDIPAKNGLKNGELSVKHPLVTKIRYALFQSNPSIVRVVIDLQKKIPYNLKFDASVNEIICDLDVPKFKVVIDPGHGGRDPGATSYHHHLEKDFTLALSKRVYQLLEKNPYIQPYMTRTQDTTVSLDDRVAFANNLHANVFLSIHGNVNDASSHIRGVETYYYRSESLPFAKVMHQHVLKATRFPDRDVRKVDFRVVKNTKMPAVLEEVGFLSNPTDESNLYNASMQQKIAEEIVAAILEYLHI